MERLHTFLISFNPEIAALTLVITFVIGLASLVIGCVSIKQNSKNQKNEQKKYYNEQVKAIKNQLDELDKESRSFWTADKAKHYSEEMLKLEGLTRFINSMSQSIEELKKNSFYIEQGLDKGVLIDRNLASLSTLITNDSDLAKKPYDLNHSKMKEIHSNVTELSKHFSQVEIK